MGMGSDYPGGKDWRKGNRNPNGTINWDKVNEAAEQERRRGIREFTRLQRTQQQRFTTEDDTKRRKTPGKYVNANRQFKPGDGLIRWGSKPQPQLRDKVYTSEDASFGYGGHERGNEQEDRLYRESRPWTMMRSAYSSIVGDTPQLSPGDRSGATRMVGRLDEAIERGGWTRNEWKRLYTLRDKWRERASGQDDRYNLVGNRQGGLTKQEQDRLKVTRSIRTINSIGRGGNKGERNDK